MKKRILYLAIPALFASLTLSACNEDPTQQNNNNNPTVEKYSFTFELDAPEAIKDDIKYTLSNGNGEYDKGTKIAVNISSYDSVNYSFDGYFVNNSKVTTETSYTVDLQSDTTLVAKFSAKGGEEKPDPTPDPDPDPTPEPDNPSFDEVEIGEVVETGKLGLWQQTNGEAIYFDGEMDEKNTFYFGTTTDFASAPDIKAVKVSETELTLEITSGTNVGKYISAKNAIGTDGKPHNNILIESAAFNWTYNATYDAYTAKLTDSDEVFIGNYSNYSTISLSDVEYFEGNGNNIAHIVQSEITDQTSGGGSTSGGQSENPVGDKSISLPSGDKTLKTKYKAISVDEYYKNIDFNDKSTLEQNLLTLTQKNFDQIHYDEARWILQYTDASLEDESKIYGVYDGQLVNAHWDANNNWNREHLWPASRLPNGRSDTKEGADLFNLRASYYKTNGKRGNNYYSENGEGGFYPIIDGNTDADQRGDSARAIFYMAFKYGGIGLGVVENPKGNVGYDDHYYKMGILSTLIEWNQEDPVDEFEMRRNERIYEFQGNRNPFVDRPELVDLFF